jgi:uncharacterized protein with von Willebrand factor type A (vWA) domain
VFDLLLINLRAQGLKVGVGEWLVFLDALRRGLVATPEELYQTGRALLVHDLGHYDAWDQAFHATFEGVELPAALREELLKWLAEVAPPTADPERRWDLDPDELRRRFQETLEQQRERHDGGSRWVGTGGTSPFGRGGRASGGVQVGGGGGRSAMMVAGDREWKDYRVDRQLDHRDLQVALRALRDLAREGAPELDVDRTIRRTADQAGDIDLVFQRGRKNRVHLRLILDTGGSMSPHARLVEQLFTAADGTRGFKSFEPWFFHNAPYGWLWRSFSTGERAPIEELIRGWPQGTRVLFVGDASMAPHELFEPYGEWRRGRWEGGESGLGWLQRLRRAFPASAWLNPDPPRWWDHPTVRAVGAVFPMHPLTVDGLRAAVRGLRLAGAA